MQLIREHAGWNWKLDDPAGLYLSGTGEALTAPVTIHCAHMSGFAAHNEGEGIDVPIEGLEYMAAGIFGEPRGNTTKWTGDSHRFAIYRIDEGFSKTEIVLLETNGSGMFGYLFTGVGVFDTWRHLAATSTPEQLWDLSKMVSEAYKTARKIATFQMEQAAIDKRIKIRKRHGRTYVEVDSATTGAVALAPAGYAKPTQLFKVVVAQQG